MVRKHRVVERYRINQINSYEKFYVLQKRVLPFFWIDCYYTQKAHGGAKDGEEYRILLSYKSLRTALGVLGELRKLKQRVLSDSYAKKTLAKIEDKQKALLYS